MSHLLGEFQFLAPRDRSDARRNEGSTKSGPKSSKTAKKNEAGAIPSRITCQQRKVEVDSKGVRRTKRRRGAQQKVLQ
jgi:hypothetical protein